MVDQHEARAFAESWVAAWNAHDVEQVLCHFADDVVFSSPLIASLMGEPSSTVRGKDHLRSYWKEGLRRIPDLRFDLVEVYTGVETIAISYRNQAGRSCLETGTLDGDGRITRGWALYG
jgi:hypothetical protein